MWGKAKKKEKKTNINEKTEKKNQNRKKKNTRGEATVLFPRVLEYLLI
jgi:hypothetical protein